MILAMSTVENATLLVFNAVSEVLLLLNMEPPKASSIAMGAYLPTNITTAVDMLKNGVFARLPRKSEPLFAAALVNS